MWGYAACTSSWNSNGSEKRAATSDVVCSLRTASVAKRARCGGPSMRHGFKWR